MLAGLFFLLISSQAAHAEKIRASVIDIAPFGFIEGGQKKGLNIEILEALASAGSFEVDIQLAPYLRAISLVESKEVDLTLMFDTEISKKMKTKKAFLYRRNLNVYTLKDRSFLSAKTISGEIGRLNGACTELENPQINFFNLGSFEQGISLLEKKRLKGICGSHAATSFAFNKMGLQAAKFKYIMIAKKDFSVHFHPDTSDEKIGKIKKAIQIIQKNGVLQKIRNKYQDIDP